MQGVVGNFMPVTLCVSLLVTTIHFLLDLCMASLTSQAEEIPIIVMSKAHGRGACAAHVYVTRHAQATELAGSPYQRVYNSLRNASY